MADRLHAGLAGAFLLALVAAIAGCTGTRTVGPSSTAWPPALQAGAGPDLVVLPDFSYAGYGFGLSEIPEGPGTIIRAIDHGVIADDAKDDSKALLRALASAADVPGRVTLVLPAGRVQISEVIPLDRSALVLRGAGQGKGGTELFFPRPLKVVDKSGRQDELRSYLVRESKIQREPDQNIDHLFSEYSWSGGFLLTGPKDSRPVSYDGDKDKQDAVITPALLGEQFGKTLEVETSAGLQPGQVIQVQWFAVDGSQSTILESLYGDLAPWNDAQTDAALKLSVGSHHWTFTNRPVVSQTTRIAAISGNTVTLGDPLLHAVSEAQPAVLADWEHLTEVGIEDMKLTFPMSPWFGHHLEQGYNGIYFTGVFDGWVRNVTIENADSGILTDNAASLTIDNVTTTGAHRAHYAVHVGAVHNVLVRNLRVENAVIHPLSINTRATRSVYLRSVVLQGGLLDQHSGSNHQNLFDNLIVHLDARRGEDGQWSAPLWVGGGAGYWKPGHGLYNTHWNIRLVFAEGPRSSETVWVRSGLEGPGARIVGLHGNRQIEIDYKPSAYVHGTNSPVGAAPSLYEHQLSKRK